MRSNDSHGSFFSGSTFMYPSKAIGRGRLPNKTKRVIMNNSMGMLNRAVDDPLMAARRKRATPAPVAPAAPAPKNRQMPPPPPPSQPANNVPAMYLPPPKPAAAAADTNAKLEMWRKRREERQRAVLPSPPPPPPPPAIIPSTELRASQPAPPLNDSPMVILQQRLQEYGLALNNLQNQIDNMKTSVKAMQGQSTEDRKMLLHQVTVQDFKDMHSDLNDAVTQWCEETEKKLTEALQEINDRSFQMNAEVLEPSCPVLSEPQLSSQLPQEPLLPVHQKIRVSYPQTKTEEGVFMRYLKVNDVAEISYLWIPVVVGNTRYVGKFSV